MSFIFFPLWFIRRFLPFQISSPEPPREVDQLRLQLIVEVSGEMRKIAGSKFMVETDCDASLLQLKLAILEAVGISKLETKHIYLRYGEKQLLDDALALEQYKISENGSTLLMEIRAEVLDETNMCANIKTGVASCCNLISSCRCRVRMMCFSDGISCCCSSYRKEAVFSLEDGIDAFGCRGHDHRTWKASTQIDIQEDVHVQKLHKVVKFNHVMGKSKTTKAINYLKDVLRNVRNLYLLEKMIYISANRISILRHTADSLIVNI